MIRLQNDLEELHDSNLPFRPLALHSAYQYLKKCSVIPQHVQADCVKFTVLACRRIALAIAEAAAILWHRWQMNVFEALSELHAADDARSWFESVAAHLQQHQWHAQKHLSWWFLLSEWMHVRLDVGLKVDCRKALDRSYYRVP